MNSAQKVASRYLASGGWETLEGRGLAKFLQVFEGQFPGPASQYEGDVYAKKFGRKTVFVKDSGVLRLYCAGDDGNIYSLKIHTGFPPPDNDCRELVDAAAGLLDPIAYRKSGVYMNGRWK
jgi:hypothetical protein